MISELCHVSVEFTESLSVDQVAAEISRLSTPQVIIWYIGCYGLRKAGVQFYKDFLIHPVLSQNAGATFWLVDLTAWNAFKNARGSIHSVNSCCDVIEKFSDNRMKCIRAATIFKKMQGMLEKDVIEYFRTALAREFIHRPSQNFPDIGIRVRDVFSDSCPIMADLYEHDVSKAYSAFQYLEGCLLVEEIFTQQVECAKELTLVFALPNDELKYYRDNANSFQKDVEFLLSRRCKAQNIENIKIQIKFLSFRYGSEMHHRPYNAPGSVLKINDLAHEDIMDSHEITESRAYEVRYAARL